MGLFFNYPTIWRSFALKTPSKVVIFDQNKVKYLGALIDIFDHCCLAQSWPGNDAMVQLHGAAQNARTLPL